MLMPRVLVVDDEDDIRELIKLDLESRGLAVSEAGTLAEAYRQLEAGPVDLCLTDMRLPDGDGISLVSAIAQRFASLPVAVITAYGSVESAVAALKAGAFDFIAKPIDMAVLRAVVENGVRRSAVRDMDAMALIGDSPAVAALRDAVEVAARNRAPVALSGEPGAGKSLVAREIHRLSGGRERPFVTVNCADLPAEQLHEALFGGAAAQAIAGDERGFLQAAQGGTLYLNQVDALPSFIQSRLLEVIQQRSLEAWPGREPQVFDVRLVSSASEGLEKALGEGRLRHDLYYRLHVVSIKVPPLREHLADLPALSRHILETISQQWGQPVASLSEAAEQRLRAHAFPGNVRELENVLERAVVRCRGQNIVAEDIEFAEAETGPRARNAVGDELSSLPARLEADERAAILAALEKTHWNRTAAARDLGMTFRQLRYRIKKFGIEDAPG